MAWTRSRWLRRAALFAPAVGCALLAVMLVGAASSTRVLACDRAAARCTWSTASWYERRDHAFAIDSVREIRFIDGLGKGGRRAETALLFATGHELHVAGDDTDSARGRHAAIAAFFAGRGRDLRDEERGGFWLFAAAVAAAIAAVVLAASAARRRLVDTVDPVVASPPRPALLSRPRVRLMLLLIGLVVAAQAALMIVAELTQGTLVLDCRRRCRFQGGECLPGGGLRSTLDPGDYTIDIWAASGPERWHPRAFSIAVGEVTHVVCE
jgi:hypothetical protein